MGTTLRHVVVWWCCLALLCPTFLLSQLALPSTASAQPTINAWGEFDSGQDREEPPPPPESIQPQTPNTPSAPTSGRPLPDTVNFPAGTDMRVYDKTKAEVEKLREKLDKGEGIRYPSGQPRPHPWYSGNPASESQWRQDSVNAIIGDLAGMAAGGIVPTFSPPNIPVPSNLPPGVELPAYTPGNMTAPVSDALTNAFGDLGKFSPEAMAIFYDCFQPKISYDLMPDLSFGCPYCPIPTGGKNKYMDIVAKICGVKKAQDNRGYIVDYWWPEYEVELNNFAISAFNPTLTCPEKDNPYSRTNLTSKMDQLLRPVFLKEKATEQGVTTLPSFPPGLRKGVHLGQSAWEGVFATDQTINLEAHVYRSYLSVATSMSRPKNRDKGYKQKDGECCFYNALPPPPSFHPIVNGWTEQFPAAAFWRTEELSQLLDPEAYEAVRPIDASAVRRIKLASDIPTGCTAYRAGRDLGNGNDYRDLISAVNISPTDYPVLKKICYPGGGDLFPVTGKLIGNFNRLPAAAYLARRAIYLFGEKTSNYGSKAIVSPDRRINRFNDERDKLQRVSPGVSRCFSMKDVPNFLKDGSGNFPNDAIKPEHNGSIRYMYWNHRRACMCPKVGPAVLFFGILPFCDTIRPACFSMMNGDKPIGDDEKNFSLNPVPPYPSPVPPPGIPYPFFGNKKCKLCPSAQSNCKSSLKNCGPFSSKDLKDLQGEAPTWYLWLMRGLSALEAIANPAAFFGPNFLAGIPAQLREQVLLIINEQATNVREIFVSSLNNIKGIAPELQQQFLELTSQFKTQAGLENYLQSVTGMTKEGLESYLNTLKNLPDEFKDKYVELAKTPEGRQALTRLFNSAVPSDYGRILELGAGMSPRELQKFADSFTSLNPKDRDFLLKLSENGLLKGPISDILKEVGPGGLKGIIDLGNSIDPKQYSDFLNNIRDLNGTTMQQAITMLSDPELRTAGVNLINNISPGVLPSFLDLAKDVDPRKIGDTFRNLDEKTAKELDKLMSDPEARKKLIASIEQRTPLEVPGIINFAAGLSNDKYKEIWDTVKDDDKFIAMLKDEKKRNGVLGVFNELAPGQTPRVVEFFSKLPNEKYEKGWDALTDMDGALQKEFGKLVQDPKSRDRFLKNLESVPGVTVPTMIRNFSSVPNEDLKEMWKKMDKMDPSVEQDFNRIMGKPDTGSAFTRMSNSFGESFISQIDSAVKLSESSLTQLGAALEGVDRVPGTSSESFSRIIAEPSSRKQMESLVNSLTTQQVSGLVQNLGSISNQQFQRFSGVVQTLPPGVQQTVLGAASQVTGGASDVSKYIEQVGTTTFVKQATSMTPQQLAQEIKKTTPR